jgi:NAD(P)-dependent dehydrogenase (short-subunit alcohol dehydrogenase family)
VTKPLDGQHALITGASRGIGAAVAKALAEAGATLSLTARNEDAVSAVAAVLSDEYGIAATGYAADATDADQVGAAIRNASAAHGPPTILVNNAGGADSVPFLKETRAQWDHTLTLNLTSTFVAMQAVLPAMLEAGYGRVINMASTAGLKGYAYVSSYCAAKHGVIGLTRATALETARKGVTVNAVCPGYTDTPMVANAVDKIVEKSGRTREKTLAELAAGNPQRRLVDPEEVAATVLWLALPSSSSITGQSIAVAGGEVM